MARTAVTPAGATTGVRVGTAERERVGDLLGQALALGYVDVGEYEERLDRAMAATRAGELDGVLADLPLDEIARRDPARRARRVAAARREAAAHVGAYLAGMALMVGIWLVVGIAAGSWYPWPVWPALGWGVGVVARVVPLLGPGAADGRRELRVGGPHPNERSTRWPTPQLTPPT